MQIKFESKWSVTGLRYAGQIYQCDIRHIWGEHFQIDRLLHDSLSTIKAKYSMQTFKLLCGIFILHSAVVILTH